MKQIQKRKAEDEKFGRSALSFNSPESPPMSPIARRVALSLAKPSLKDDGPMIDLDPVELETKTIAKQVTSEQRYWFYVERGINNKDLARLEPQSIKKIKSLIKQGLLTRNDAVENLLDEVKRGHCLAIKQSIVDYILLDPTERARLMIPKLQENFVPRVCRAPVPWHESLFGAKDCLANNLFISNPMMLSILAAYEPYKNTKIVDMSVFSPVILPISVDEFGAILKAQCQAFKAKMLNEYFRLI
jgi:dynein heavy chain, axonemal